MVMRSYLAWLNVASLLTIASVIHAGPVPVRWDVETSRPAPIQLDVYRGETITLQPRMLSYGTPIDITNSTLTIYWQTNGMGQAWWQDTATAIVTEPGRISATWSPDKDTGAASYTFFIGATDPSGTSYRAYGTMRMRHSPGWSPTALPPPPAVWVSPAELLAVSNALANALQPSVAAIMATGSVHHASVADVVTGNQSNLIANALQASDVGSLSVSSARSVVQSDTNAWIVIHNGTGLLYRVEEVINTNIFLVTVETDMRSVGEPIATAGVYRVDRLFSEYGRPKGVFGELKDGAPMAYIYYGTAQTQYGYFPAPSPRWFVVRDDIKAFPGGEDVWIADDDASTLPQILRHYDSMITLDEDTIVLDYERTLITNTYSIATVAGTALMITAHATDPAAHPDRPNYAAVTNIVGNMMSTNHIGGWRVWDSGSNRFWTVNATDLRFFVWE